MYNNVNESGRYSKKKKEHCSVHIEKRSAAVGT
jgi:hypothetical protein